MRRLLPVAISAAVAAPSSGQDLNEIHALEASDAESFDLFGYDVSLDGRLVLIGAPGADTTVNTSGAAYLFDATTGAELFILTPSDPQTNDSFGRYLALDGSIALISSYGDDDNGTDSGSVYCFDATTGIEIGKFAPNDGAADDRFGRGIALDGNIAIIGAAGDQDNGADSGSAYIFDVSTGTQLHKLLPDDGSASDHFGRSVAIDGDLCVVGASGHESAYVFSVSTGNQIAQLLPVGGTSNAFFGTSVAIEGDRALVGAYYEDHFGTNSGAVYVFQASTGSFLFELVPPNSGMFFGFDVAIDNGTVIVGEYGSSVQGLESGEAILYELSSGNQLARLIPTNGTTGDWLGFSVDLYGNTAVAGAYKALFLNRGAAYVFRSAVSIPTLPEWGLLSMSLVLLITGSILISRRRTAGN